MRTVVAVLALVACVHAGLWALLRTKETAPDFSGQLASVSYAPFADSSHPDTGQRPTAEQIRADLKAIAPYTRAIRTYSSTGGAELVPPIAAEFGLKVTVGAWIDKDKERNEREIRSALDLARPNSNVNDIVVGKAPTLLPAGKTGPFGSTSRSLPRPSTSTPRTSCPTGRVLITPTRSTIRSSS